MRLGLPTERAACANNSIPLFTVPCLAARREMLDQGVNVGLGVDGACSSDAQNLLAEARLALLLKRAHGNPNGLGCR